jgi:hypothetical protein
MVDKRLHVNSQNKVIRARRQILINRGKIHGKK